ncbi:MAG: PAS domain S-box protein [Nitrospirae bacterium]|nr:PAS domain S-box protein [Nitrospirota bacterium]
MPLDAERRKSTHRTINRNSLIIWLFFITFTVNLTVFLFAFEINNVLRLFILAESRFKGHYYNAVISLKTYLDSRSESDFQDYKAHLVPLYLYKSAQDELDKQNLDFRLFSTQMKELKFGDGDIFRIAIFFRTLRNSEFFKVSKNIIQEGSKKVQSLDLIGEYYHQNLKQNPVNQITVKESIEQLRDLDRRMEYLFSEFSDKINYLYFKMTLISEVATSSIGICLLFFGIYASRKIIEKSEIDRKALENSEARLRLSMEQMPASIWTTDPFLRITTSTGAVMIEPSPGGEPILGRSIPTLLEKSPLKELIVQKHQDALKGESGHYEFLFGARFWTAHVEPFRDRNGLITGVLGIAYDITEKKSQESKLIAEKERLLVTLGSIGDAVITTDKEGRVTLMNPVAQDLSGWSQAEAEGKFLPEVFQIYNELTGSALENPVSKVISTGRTVAIANHTILKSRDGTVRAIADSGAPIQDSQGNILGVVLVFRDVTQQMKIQNELLKKMKLDSLGLLAGGIAHDFNNILTAILGNISLAKTELDPGLTAIRYLNETETATLKARDLSSQLLAFTKGGAPQKKVTSIARLVEESTRFVLRGSNIKSVFYFPDNLWLGEFDPGQIAQVVHNLVINSKQAMSDGGEIIISAANTNIEEPRATALILDVGPYVAITFKDNGKGIPSG